MKEDKNKRIQALYVVCLKFNNRQKKKKKQTKNPKTMETEIWTKVARERGRQEELTGNNKKILGVMEMFYVFIRVVVTMCLCENATVCMLKSWSFHYMHNLYLEQRSK